MADWLSWFQARTDTLAWLGVVAVLSWVITLFAVPLFVARIPVDYFTRGHRHPLYEDSLHPVIGWVLASIKNILGALLLAAGLVLLFTPGQGVLTILIGLMLLNFPGKYAAERWVVSRPGVMRSLNWMRQKVGKPPLDAP